MSSRILASLRAVGPVIRPNIAAGPVIRPNVARTFRSSAPRAQEAAAGTGVSMPSVRRPVGAFRGGVFGFLLGTSAAAYGTYAYVLEEYRLSNEMLTEDIYALQAAVTRIHDYVRSLEEKVEAMEKRK